MNVWLILAAFVVFTDQKVCFSDFDDPIWTDFKMTHGKVYTTFTEETFRRKIFLNNLNKIKAHNERFNGGHVTYKLEMNQFGDLLRDEFVRIYNGFRMFKSETVKTEMIRHTFMPPANVELPAAVDWRKDGAVTPVKNQGSCGSCWSFSVTGALEGQHFRKTKKLVSLSEQNLIDCTRLKFNNTGCSGGEIDASFEYIKYNGGIDTEVSYPYEGVDGKCRYKSSAVGATDIGLVDIKQGNEEDLKSAVATIGPVAVAIDADHESFQFYNHGIYYEPDCSSENLDHAVLVVGYGTSHEGLDYWIVKNSWGSHWGKDGYILISRNKQNHCGIASLASYPIV